MARLPRSDISRNAKILASGLLIALVAVAAYLLVQPDRVEHVPPPHSPDNAPVVAFAGSDARLFLTKLESVEAARRGLAPRGTRSIIRIGHALEFGEWHWDEQGVPEGRMAVRVDLARQLVSVYRGPDEIGTAVILYGAKGKETPLGKLPILGKSRDHHSRIYDAPMPYSLWLRNDGVAVHGTTVSAGRASNGCIGVPVEFAAKLFDAVDKGDIVEVIGGRDSAA